MCMAVDGGSIRRREWRRKGLLWVTLRRLLLRIRVRHLREGSRRVALKCLELLFVGVVIGIKLLSGYLLLSAIIKQLAKVG